MPEMTSPSPSTHADIAVTCSPPSPPPSANYGASAVTSSPSESDVSSDCGVAADSTSASDRNSGPEMTPERGANGRCYMTLRNKHCRLSSYNSSDYVEPNGLHGSRAQRRERTKDACRPLRHWLYGHKDTPYPSRADKLHLSAITQLSVTQVSNWFANARRRLKNTVDRAVRPKGGQEDWARRIRLYNRHTVGNQERLSISSDDLSDCDLDDLDNDLEEQEARGLTSENDHQESRLISSERDEMVAQRLFGDAVGFHQQSPWPLTTPRHHLYPEEESAWITAQQHGHHQQHLHHHKFGPDSDLDPSDEIDDDGFRHRNASGSLSSHDFEEMSSSSSIRSSPAHDVQLQQLCCHGNDGDEYGMTGEYETSGPHEVLHWKEISAALALTTLARSHLQHQQHGVASLARF